MHTARFFVISLLFLCPFAGCDSGPKFYPATGTVTYEGKPVDGAMVTFTPEKGSTGSSTTDAAGKFTIMSDGKPGAVVGTHKVTVAKSSMAAGVSPAATPDDMRKMQTSGAAKAKALLPEKYSNVHTTDLSAVVTTDGAKNNFTLDLK